MLVDLKPTNIELLRGLIMTEKKQHKKKKTSEVEYEQKIGELTELLQRLQAEFENYKKRVDVEKAEFIKYSKAELIEKLLPIVDSFELALRNTGRKDDFVKGVELIYSQLYGILEKEGIRRIECLNKKFDPNTHEVMIVVENDAEPDTIIER